MQFLRIFRVLLKTRESPVITCNLHKLFSKSDIFPNLKTSHVAGYATKFRMERNTSRAENSFAYKVMADNPNYQRTISSEKSIIDVKNKSPLIQMISVDSSEQLHENLPSIIIALKESIEAMSDQDLMNILQLLSKWPTDIGNTELFSAMCQVLDDECVKRIPKWNVDDSLLVADFWFKMSLIRHGEYMWAVTRKYTRKVQHLSNTQIVQLMFYVNLCRKLPTAIPQFEIEFCLVDVINYLSLDETAIVAMAFFKTDTKMKNRALISSLVDKLLMEGDTCRSITLGIMLKALRHSTPPHLDDKLAMVLKMCHKQLPRLELQTLTHLSLLGTNTLTCDFALMRDIIDKVSKNIAETRLKDLERIVFSLSHFNIADPAFCQLVLSELEKRTEEVKEFARPFVSLINFLAVLDVYPEHFINMALSEETIHKVFRVGGKLVGRELLYIDSSVEIDLPNYKGNRLDPKQRKLIARNTTFLPSMRIRTGAEDMLYCIEGHLQSLFGAPNVYYGKVVPHHATPDFIIGFNSRQQPVPAPESWTPHIWGNVKRPPDQENVWIALIVGHRNTIIRHHNLPLGTTAAKMRQLEKLGYKPLLVTFSGLMERREEDKKIHLKELIENKLKESLSQNELRENISAR